MAKYNRQFNKQNKITKIRSYFRDRSYRIAVNSLNIINKRFNISENKKLKIKIPNSILTKWLENKDLNLIRKDSIKIDKETKDILLHNEKIEKAEIHLISSLWKLANVAAKKRNDIATIKNDNKNIIDVIDKYNHTLKKFPKLQKKYALIDEKDYLRDKNGHIKIKNPIQYQLKGSPERTQALLNKNLDYVLKQDLKLDLADETTRNGNEIMDKVMGAREKYIKDDNKPVIPPRTSSKNNPKNKAKAKDDIDIPNKVKTPKIPKRSSSLGASQDKKEINMDDVKKSKTYNKNQDNLAIQKPRGGLKRSQSLTSTKSNNKKPRERSYSKPIVKL